MTDIFERLKKSAGGPIGMYQKYSLINSRISNNDMQLPDMYHVRSISSIRMSGYIISNH